MREGRQSFDIRTAKDFFHKLEEECADFRQNRLSARHAINAAMTAWHLQEWLWADMLKGNYSEQKRILNQIIQDPKDFVPAVLDLCDKLSIMQDICNGSKHFKAEGTVSDTGIELDESCSSQVGVAQIGTMWTGSAGLPYLAVITEGGDSISFESALDEVLTFWRSIFHGN